MGDTIFGISNCEFLDEGGCWPDFTEFLFSGSGRPEGGVRDSKKRPQQASEGKLIEGKDKKTRQE